MGTHSKWPRWGRGPAACWLGPIIFSASRWQRLQQVTMCWLQRVSEGKGLAACWLGGRGVPQQVAHSRNVNTLSHRSSDSLQPPVCSVHACLSALHPPAPPQRYNLALPDPPQWSCMVFHINNIFGTPGQLLRTCQNATHLQQLGRCCGTPACPSQRTCQALGGAMGVPISIQCIVTPIRANLERQEARQVHLHVRSSADRRLKRSRRLWTWAGS